MLKFVGNARQLFAAEHFSRRHFQSGIGFISLHMSFPCMSRFVFSPYFVMQYEGSAKSFVQWPIKTKLNAQLNAQL